MNIKRVPISKVDVWEKNPRNIKTKDFERLKKQIKELGVYKPLICVQENGKYTTLGGNMRLRALREMGIQEIDISIIKAETEAEKIKYALSDNDRAGEYMEDELAELVYPHKDEIGLEDFKIDLGEPVDLQNLIEDYAPNLDGSEDEVPEVDDSPAITKSGDLFTLGRHRLLCGDSTKVEDVARLMDGKGAALLTDPPYNVGLKYKSIDDNKTRNDFISWCTKWFDIAKNISKKKVVFIGNVNAQDWILNFSPDYIGIWDKGNGATTHGYITEYTLWEPVFFHGQFNRTRHNDIFRFVAGSGKFEHPCPKPISLIKDIIENFIETAIVDLFLGSGTTLIAAEKTGRICYGMEIEPKYCDVVIKRYCDYMGTPEDEIRATVEHG